jgi:hypothetical protein
MAPSRWQFAAEEVFVRDLYARLMRYQFAAVELRETPAIPADDLSITISELRTAGGLPPRLPAPRG